MISSKDYLINNAEVIQETNEYALNKKKALEYIDLLKREKKFILGGDVYEKKDNTFFPIYDSWYLQLNDGTYLDSFEKAKKFISKYLRDDIYFVIVVN